MDWNLKKMWPVAAASLVAFTSLLSADDSQMQNRQMRDGNMRRDDKMRRDGDRRDGQKDGRWNNGYWRDYDGDECCDNQGPCDLPLAYTPNASCWYPSDCECGGWFDNWTLTAAATWWKACEDGLEYVVEVDSPVARASVIDGGEMEHPHSRYSWGFKVGLGYDFEHDGWDAQATYTWFHSRQHHHHHDDGDCCTTSTEVLYPLYSDLEGTALNQLTATEAEAEWKVRMNYVDLELGRAFFTSRWLTLRPHMGIRGAWIHQKLDLEYKDTNSTYPVTSAATDDVDMKNHFWGVGVRGGLDSRWAFCGGWSIYGNLAISILAGRFHVEHSESATVAGSTVETNVLNFEESFCTSRAVTDLALGLMWEHTFCGGCDDKCEPEDSRNRRMSRRSGERPGYHLALALGWEQHIWFNQNQFWRVTRPSGANAQSFAHERGDLTTQGLTLTATVGF